MSKLFIPFVIRYAPNGVDAKKGKNLFANSL